MSNELEATYQQRFAGAEEGRLAVWQVLCKEFFQEWIKPADAVLDIGAGYCEFINSINAGQKFALDLNPSTPQKANSGVKVLAQDVAQGWSLESQSVDVVFSSNFLEHLPSKAILSHCMKEIARVLRTEGIVILMGPNIRFCYDVYWDFIDHHLPLSDRSIEEALSLHGLTPEKVIPRFLPYTMQGKPSPSPYLVKLYLMMPFVWPVFGKQFLVVARKK